MMSQHSRRKLPRGNPRKGKHAEADKAASPKAVEPKPTDSNRILAGYLAHEFLTKGTLLGRKFELDSSRAGLSGSSSAVEPRQSARKEEDSYVEVASILKIDGAHIKGIVNPTQLSNWINNWPWRGLFGRENGSDCACNQSYIVQSYTG